MDGNPRPNLKTSPGLRILPPPPHVVSSFGPQPLTPYTSQAVTSKPGDLLRRLAIPARPAKPTLPTPITGDLEALEADVEGESSHSNSSGEMTDNPTSPPQDMPQSEGAMDLHDEHNSGEPGWSRHHVGDKRKGEFLASGPKRRKGKDNRDKAGWANLPVKIIHLVMDHLLRTIEAPEIFSELVRFGGGERCETILMVLRRIELSSMRRVSVSWRKLIDAHPFWLRYPAFIDPSRPHRNLFHDHKASLMAPSTPSFSSHFLRARFETLHTCLPCRINSPGRLGRYPANPRYITWTTYLGWAPTCGRHCGTYCTSCMAEVPGYLSNSSRMGFQFVPEKNRLDLAKTETHDHDENENSRRHVNLCGACRAYAVHKYLPKLMTRYNKTNGVNRMTVDEVNGSTSADADLPAGGKFWRRTMTKALNKDVALDPTVPGLQAIRKSWDDLIPSHFYLGQSIGTVSDCCRRMLEEFWLDKHARWTELLVNSVDLEHLELELRRRFVLERKGETKEEKTDRLTLMAELMGTNEGDDAWRRMVRENARYMEGLYLQWEAEVVQGRLTKEDVQEELEPVGLENSFEDIRWWFRHRTFIVNDFIRDRISLGFFVFPGDELDFYKTSPPRVAYDFRAIAELSTHPLEMFEKREYTPEDGVRERMGITAYSDEAIEKADIRRFFPPPSLVKLLNETFKTCLQQLLKPALIQIAKALTYALPPDADVKHQFNDRAPEWILEALARPEPWIIGGWKDLFPREPDARRVSIDSNDEIGSDESCKSGEPSEPVTHPHASPQVDTRRNLRRSRSPGKHADVKGVSPKSPRVEVVTEAPEDINWGIQEERVSPVTPNSIEDVLKIQEIFMSKERDAEERRSKSQQVAHWEGNEKENLKAEESKKQAGTVSHLAQTTPPPSTTLSPVKRKAEPSPDDPRYQRKPFIQAPTTDSQGRPINDPGASAAKVTVGSLSMELSTSLDSTTESGTTTILTPPDDASDSSHRPAIALHLPEHLQDVSPDDLAAIIAASGNSIPSAFSPTVVTKIPAHSPSKTDGSAHSGPDLPKTSPSKENGAGQVSDTMSTSTISSGEEDDEPDFEAEDLDQMMEEEEMDQIIENSLNNGSPSKSRTTSRRTKFRFIMDLIEVPYIPFRASRELLGPGTTQLLRDLWLEVLDEVVVCECMVCKRDRLWQFMDESGDDIENVD